MLTRNHTPLLWSLILYAGGSCLIILHPYHELGGDFALYISQAKAILEGGTHNLFELNSQSMRLSDTKHGPDLYPPGYPLMLSAIYYFSGLDLQLLKLPAILCFVGFLFVMYKYILTLSFPLFIQIMVLALCALNPILIIVSELIISDIPFLFVSTLFFYQLTILPNTGTNPIRFILIGLILTITLMIRSIGIIHIFTLFVVYSAKLINNKSDQKQKPTTLLQHLFLLLLPLAIYLIIYPQVYPTAEYSYLFFIKSINLNQAYQNLLHYLQLPANILGPVGWLFYVSTIPLILIGIYSHFHRYRLELTFCVLYTVLIILWPFVDGFRFLIPIFPFVIVFFSSGISSLYDTMRYPKRSRFLKRVVIYCAIPTIFLIHAVFIYRNLRKDHSYTFGNVPSLDMFHFIRQHTHPEDIIIFPTPRVMYLYTGRMSYSLSNPNEIIRSSAKYYVQYRIQQQSVPFTFLHQNKEYTVYNTRD